ncbi:hypothetical protein BC827DRAFT_1212140 [Russula dissimulans]|nr:hypothetical protein BC827DRAFT_1212140 [Russula dissimulans]
MVGNDKAFTDAFAKGSHIKLRSFNLVVSGIPITFDPENEVHLREVEEVSELPRFAVTNARWIKPLNRRRPDQTLAFAILTFHSTGHANNAIKNGLIICGAKVRPKKQKQEPLQCMKCRRWGHLAMECLANADTCGKCGEDHRTATCANRNKTHCVNCNNNTHTSWSRDCPEFLPPRLTFPTSLHLRVRISGAAHVALPRPGS